MYLQRQCEVQTFKVCNKTSTQLSEQGLTCETHTVVIIPPQQTCRICGASFSETHREGVWPFSVLDQMVGFLSLCY